MLGILRPQFLRFRIVAEVVIAIRKAEAALIRDRADHARFLEIGFRAKTEERADAHRVEIGEKRRQSIRRRERGHFRQRRIERRRTLGVDRGFVHAGRVVVADLFRLRIRVRIPAGVFEDLSERCVVALLQLLAAAPGGTVGGNRLVLRPAAARVRIEVVTRIRAAIHELQIEARRRCRRARRRRRRRLRVRQRRCEWKSDQNGSEKTFDHENPSFLFHHTRHALGRTIGAFGLHANAFWNSGMFDSGPFTRYLLDECGLVAAFTRSASGRAFSHQTCAHPTSTRCSGVKPSTLSLFFAPGPARYAINARRTPPLSAVFSPSVSRPLTCVSPATV